MWQLWLHKTENLLWILPLGRLKKTDIENAIGARIKQNPVVLCSDAHVSYKGFAKDNKIEHHALKAVIKQRVKKNIEVAI